MSALYSHAPSPEHERQQFPESLTPCTSKFTYEEPSGEDSRCSESVSADGDRVLVVSAMFPCFSSEHVSGKIDDAADRFDNGAFLNSSSK